MKIRPALRHALLALLLLLSQQLGVTHAVSHLSAPPQRASQDQQLPVDQSCEQCLAFASIGSALTNPPFVFLVGPAHYALPVALPSGNFVPRTIAAFRSRAPPAALS